VPGLGSGGDVDGATAGPFEGDDAVDGGLPGPSNEVQVGLLRSLQLPLELGDAAGRQLGCGIGVRYRKGGGGEAERRDARDKQGQQRRRRLLRVDAHGVSRFAPGLSIAKLGPGLEMFLPAIESLTYRKISTAGNPPRAGIIAMSAVAGTLLR
jgi:hypothetical protein